MKLDVLVIIVGIQILKTRGCFVVVMFLRRIVGEPTIFDSCSQCLFHPRSRVAPRLHYLILFINLSQNFEKEENKLEKNKKIKLVVIFFKSSIALNV